MFDKDFEKSINMSTLWSFHEILAISTSCIIYIYIVLYMSIILLSCTVFWKIEEFIQIIPCLWQFYSTQIIWDFQTHKNVSEIVNTLKINISA